MYAQGQQAYSYLSGFGIPITQPIPTSIIPAAVPPQPTRATAGFGKNQTISNDTSSKDPELLKARVFIGNVNSAECTKEDLIDLCRPYGNLKALSLVKNYSFVQYETQAEAEMAIQVLNGYNFFNQKLDVRFAAIGKGSSISANSTTGPVRRPKHDFLFGGQRIRVETTNVRNRTFSQDVFGVLKDINFHDHGKNDTIICGSCRSVFTSIKPYVEHRRQKKCHFFERDVAPSVVSCFTCKEEFSESWLFIQHLIHRHSINLYRDQPESDPATYNAKYKAQKAAESKANEAPATTNGNQPAVEQQKSTNGEPEKSTEIDSTQQQPPENTEPAKESDIAEQSAADKDVEVIEPPSQSTNPIKQESMNEEAVQVTENAPTSTADDTPSYSSAISIGVSAKNPAPYVPVSTTYLQSVPSFHAQVPPPYQTLQQTVYPTYQFTQPFVTASSIQSGFPTSQYSAVSMAQSNPVTQNQKGLSEEEQMKLLEELDNV